MLLVTIGIKETGMREKEIEEYLVKRVRESGGMAYKFVSPGRSGVPDRIVVMPNGLLIFVELKAPGGSTRPLQDRQISELRRLGQMVFIIDTKGKVDAFLQAAMIESKRRGAKAR
jgi:hypothetical protein